MKTVEHSMHSTHPNIMSADLFNDEKNTRWYFASQALVGLLANPNHAVNDSESIKRLADLAFNIADHMVETGNETDPRKVSTR